ncbi:helix-turn-helix domain-containing protein [Zoogloea sp.]|uniref:helix-turn-helix domain-containing protein n=1 Tax=Zoogloea sp. TaxID=49181 RepID=UPI0035B429C2
MKTINALERGLDVLRKLNERHGQSLAELHAATGIPKPSLLRILDTLEASGFAWRAIGDGRYRRRFALILRPSIADELLAIGEIAAPFLENLRRKVIWPSDVLVFRDFRMELVETSRRQSTLGVAMYPLGYRVEMFLSAPGRAWLAFCSDAERETVLADAALHPPMLQRSRDLLRGGLADILDETRRLGYASRDPLFGGADDKDISVIDDRLDAIAVPLMAGGRVLATMNLVWPRKYRLKEQIVREHLADLQEAAASIAAAFSRAG